MTDATALPKLDELPIPEDVRVGKGWTPFMAEMADHIGAFATLQLLDRFGGEFVYVPIDPHRGKFAPVIGEDKASILRRVYGGSKMELPVGKQALLRARRAGVLAAVRKQSLTAADAARILKTRRTSISRLLADTDEGCGVKPLKLVARKRDHRQIDMFPDGDGGIVPGQSNGEARKAS